jgi:FKBP-type peptidyl-prolyl cis-trans isomerase
MRKLLTVLTLLLSGTMLPGIAQSQDTPASATKPADSAKTPAATTPKAQASTTKTPASTTKTPATSTKTAGAATKKAPAKPATAPLTLNTDKEKFSYALGMNWGQGMKSQSVDVDVKILTRGLQDALSGNKMLLTQDEARSAIMKVQNEMRAKQQAEAAKTGEANKKEGEAFLAANKTKEGVVTLPSGLQYKILQEGSGPKPTASDSVVCNYRGMLINGKEFDSSYKRGQPATFPVSGVIKGWTEALQLMPVGSKWQLFIPSALAYGERGAGADIGPDATLIFEVELLSIQGKDQPKANQPQTDQPKQ